MNMKYILKLEAERDALKAENGQLKTEVNHWKANHDNQTSKVRLLMDRPDLPVERVEAYKAFAVMEAKHDALKTEIDQLKAQLASSKEALEFAESARADWSKRHIWLITEVCDALGIDRDNATGVDIVLCVRNLVQRDTRSLKLINVELLAALKTILGINFYGNTVRDGIALTDGGDHFLRNVDASIAKAEETGGE